MSRSWIKTLHSQKTGLVLILIGLFCLGLVFANQAYQRLQPDSLSFSQAPLPVQTVDEGDLPVRVIIPSVRIDLPVSWAKVKENRWEVSSTGASYLLGSGFPGKDGNVVIYGHNKNHLFGPIRWLEKEAEIRVVNKKGEEFVYQLIETKTVSPEAVEVIATSQEPTLTLYTCTGFLDSKRFVVVAKLQANQD